jgi:hypothetical protein
MDFPVIEFRVEFMMMIMMMMMMMMTVVAGVRRAGDASVPGHPARRQGQGKAHTGKDDAAPDDIKGNDDCDDDDGDSNR